MGVVRDHFSDIYFDRCGCDMEKLMPCSGAKVMEVVIVFVARGRAGTGELCREVLQVWSKDGEFIAERDPLMYPFVGGGETEAIDSDH